MANTCLLSDESKHYLCCYHQILDEMVQGITTAKLNQGISHNFIVQMIPHHRAAIRMSRNILNVSDDRAVRRLAQRILEQRAQGIDQLEGLLTVCGRDATPQMDLRLFQRRMDLIFREMFTRMGAAPESNRLDAVYLREMIPHCRGAVRMSQNALRYGVCPEMEPVLCSIIGAQRRETGQMRAFLRRMGCQGA